MNDWIPLLQASRHWLILLCVNQAFFIFLAWLAYPHLFKKIVILMIIFSIASIFIGLYVARGRKQKVEKALDDFIREPSNNYESQLIDQIGRIYEGHVKEVASELRNLHDDVEESKLQTKNYETFIESWIHEIKTPISLLTLILENRKDEMSELVYQRVEHVRMNIDENVEKILFYARLQTPHKDYRFNEMTMSEMLEEALFEFQPLLYEKNIQLTFQNKDFSVVTDEKAFQFILRQVFSNAVKYMNEKVSGTIWLRTGFDHVKRHNYLEIADNGLGILPSDLPFIFNKGMTGNHMDRKQTTGMGLYLVKELCNELNISIAVESEYGTGFTIRFSFPFVEK